MTRTSDNYYTNGRLIAGYDYENQAWVKDGKYIRCGHPANMNCGCYGREHEGELTAVCPHWWVIDVAAGPKSIGECKWCSAKKEFWNSWPNARDKRYVPAANLGSMKQL